MLFTAMRLHLINTCQHGSTHLLAEVPRVEAAGPYGHHGPHAEWNVKQLNRSCDEAVRGHHGVVRR
jgi:hypothetical protein